MKHIKLFENFNKEEDLQNKFYFYRKYPGQAPLHKYGIKNYTINLDSTIDVDGDVRLQCEDFNKIPFKFGKVTGNFYCDDNNLESLDGCPYYVGGGFSCANNKLINLKDSPSEVGGMFNCQYNNLISLEGMTLEIGGFFNCRNNKKLKQLDSVSNIEGIIFCDDSVDISKFEGYCEKIRIIKLTDGTFTHKDIYLT